MAHIQDFPESGEGLQFHDYEKTCIPHSGMHIPESRHLSEDQDHNMAGVRTPSLAEILSEPPLIYCLVA
jgi:hypothetical protein